MKSKLPSFVTIMILTVITAIFWLSFDVYRHFTKPAADVVTTEILAPLKTFDVSKLDELPKRYKLR